MANHGGARPGAGRKPGSKNSIPAKNLERRTIYLPSTSWAKIAELAEQQGTSPTKLAANIITDWLKNSI